MNYRSRQKRGHAPTFFHTTPDQIVESSLTLTGEEAKHATTVCRLAKGSQLTVTDGAGNAYDCEIARVSRGVVHADIIRAHRRLGEPYSAVTLAVGVGKPATVDWIVEKAVELGVAAIVPVHCAGSVSGMGDAATAKRRVSRWQRLALGAMKQSMRSVLPDIHDVISLSDAMTLIDDHQKAYLADPDGAPLSMADHSHVRITKSLLFVGPEAGFTDEERAALTHAGAVPFSLGARRLRAETAAIVALTLLFKELDEL